MIKTIKVLNFFYHQGLILLCHQVTQGLKLYALHTHVTLNGQIVTASGPANFGWDPIFLPDGQTETYAELSPIVKNSISHYGKALRSLWEHLQSHVLTMNQKVDRKRSRGEEEKVKNKKISCKLTQ